MPAFEALDQATMALVKKAAAACDMAYAPYSRFQVGVLLLLDNGEIITGANVENAAFPQCLCAEQVALSQKASLFPDEPILRMVVVARKQDTTDLVPVTPCGACRQILLEFETRQKRPLAILMQTSASNWIEVGSAAALLPYGFVPSNLL